MPVFEWSGEMASYGKTLYDTVPDRDGLRRPSPEANRPVVEALDYFIVENVRSACRFLGRGGWGAR